jgi:hypothetical protein
VFWPLILAHFIADYPLQTDKMVEAKKKIPGLTFHVFVHFLTILIIFFVILRLSWQSLWVSAILLTLLHFSVDMGKNYVSKHKPEWVIWPYILDQVCHILTILLVAFVAAQTSRITLFSVRPQWLIVMIGIVIVTHMWFISERVFSYKNKPYQQVVATQMWERMLSRACWLLGLFVWPSLWSIALFALPAAYYLFRCPPAFRKQMMSIDVAVVLVVFLVLESA